MEKKLTGIIFITAGIGTACFLSINRSNTANVVICLIACGLAAYGIIKLIKSFIK